MEFTEVGIDTPEAHPYPTRTHTSLHMCTQKHTQTCPHIVCRMEFTEVGIDTPEAHPYPTHKYTHTHPHVHIFIQDGVH